MQTLAQPSPFTFPDGLTVNRLGFGAMRLTGEGAWGQPRSPDEAQRVLQRAVALGVNFIDTADAYGPGVSEEIIAQALHPYPDDLVIATKGGLLRSGPGNWQTNGTPQHLRQALEGSLKRLRLERIDLYQLHSPDGGVPLEESLGELVRLQAEGKIRHIGISNVSLAQLEAARRVAPIVSVQNQYNFSHRTSKDVLQACGQAAIAFIPWYPLATGNLARQQRLVAMAERHGATPGQVALAWLLHHSPVMLPISGTSKVVHLEENLAAARIGLSPDEMHALG